MDTAENRGGALGAWLKASATSLLVCASILCVGLSLGGAVSYGIAMYGLYLLYSIPIHGAGLLVIGLPFFLYFWSTPTFPVWKWPISITLGFVLGYFAMLISLTVVSIGSSYGGDFIVGSLFGGGYGAVTALVSYIFHRRSLALEVGTVSTNQKA